MITTAVLLAGTIAAVAFLTGGGAIGGERAVVLGGRVLSCCE